MIQAAQIASQELLTERNQNNKPSEAVLVEVKTIFKEQLQKNPALLDSFLLP